MSIKQINVFYRGPLERSRLGFLLELFASLGNQVKLYWLLPHPKFHNTNHRVLEPFMESYPEIDFELISARFSEILLTRKMVNSVLKKEPDSISVSVGFTAPFFLPFKKTGTQIWCINGIPEESLLHQNTFAKRLEVSLKWYLLGKLYKPNLVITVSNRMSLYVSKKISYSKFITIPLCVDLDRFNLKSKTDRKYFTYSGSGAPWQNLKQLSEVWGCLYKLDRSISFRVISRDKRARILGNFLPENAIEFVGTYDLDKVSYFLAEAEVCFLIRKDSLVNRVSFPTKLSEYIASGAWVVVSDIDWDAADVIKKYQVGILIDPNQSTEIIAKEILDKRPNFSDYKIFQDRLEKAIDELGKGFWLEYGKRELLNAGLVFSKPLDLIT